MIRKTFICVILYKYILLKKCVLVIDITYSKGEITMAIKVTSEIKPLKKVLLHRPGKELENLTPEYLEGLLFDDIPFLEVAQQEHDCFAEVLRQNGAEVVYLHELAAEVIEDELVKEEFINQFIEEAHIKNSEMKKVVYTYLNGF